MIEKIQNKIEKEKKDKQVLNEYVKIFKNLDRAKELFKENDIFQNIELKEKNVDE